MMRTVVEKQLPELNDSVYLFNQRIKDKTFMKVGGDATVCLAPRSMNDFLTFMQKYDDVDGVYCCGNWSNVIVSDAGIPFVLDLSQLCSQIIFNENDVIVGSGVLMMNFIQECIDRSISCCEKLYTIPGRIGGMIYMNSGIPGFEIKDVLLSIECIDRYTRNIVSIGIDQLDMKYRNGNIGSNYIILSCRFKIKPGNDVEMLQQIRTTRAQRIKTQPITSNTCGSTFKNPEGHKAWELINMSGANKLSVGGARMSELHSNFLINDGTASASDVIELIKSVQDRVLKETQIMLEPEVKIVGG